MDAYKRVHVKVSTELFKVDFTEVSISILRKEM